MKTVLSASVLTLIMAMSGYATANQFNDQTCAGKKQAITTQIDYAKKANNIYQVQGLEKALADVNTYCSNDSLSDKYKEKVADKLENLQEKQKDLQEAQLKGNPQKIAKQQLKVQNAEYELKEAQNNLNEFYKTLKSE